MTRLTARLALAGIATCSFALASTAQAQTYTNPSANSRYAPANRPAENAAAPTAGPRQGVYGPQPTGPQQNYGQQPGGPQPYGQPRQINASSAAAQQGSVRPAGNEQPIRQPGVIQGAGPIAPPAAAPASPQAPGWIPLPAEHQKYVDDVLNYWEQRSSEIKTYKCAFKRWEFDPVFGPRDPKVAKSYAEGTIQYANPDKGLFKVASVSVYTPGAEGEKPQYTKQTGYGEHWVCDGKSIFEFDNRRKALIERPLPPDMQGKAIADGPLPFLFGAKAATIKARYWIRAITPPEVKGEYWLEAVPKSRHDAGNFKMVQVILDEKEFLPKGLQVFAPNFDEKTNPSRTAYAFEDREINKYDLLGAVNPFAHEFYEPKAPSGWKKIVEDLNAQVAPAEPQPAQATRRNPLIPR
jgi:TIGR03009 family protein